MSKNTMHRLTFATTDDATAQLFRTLYEGFVLGGAAIMARMVNNRQEPNFEERRAEARVLRQLKAIGVPVTDEAGRAISFRQTGAPVYTLAPNGPHVLELGTPEYTKLKEFIRATPWDTGRMDAVEDMVDFVLRAEEVSAA